MNKITVKIDGMACGMCEAHICDTIRKIYPNARKAKASRTCGEATFILDGAVDEKALAKAIGDTGYTFVGASIEEYKKRGLFK